MFVYFYFKNDVFPLMRDTNEYSSSLNSFKTILFLYISYFLLFTSFEISFFRLFLILIFSSHSS